LISEPLVAGSSWPCTFAIPQVFLLSYTVLYYLCINFISCLRVLKGKKKRNTKLNLDGYQRLDSQDETGRETNGPQVFGNCNKKLNTSSAANVPKTNSEHETKSDVSFKDSTIPSNEDIKLLSTPISETGTPDVLSDDQHQKMLINKQMHPHPLATARDGIAGGNTEFPREYKPPYFKEASNENQSNCK